MSFTRFLLAPHVYGWEHLTYLAVFIALAAGSLVFIKLKVKDQKIIDIIIKCAGGVLLIFIVWNRISLAFRHNTALWAIPNSLCGATSLVLAICAIFCKRDHLALHYCLYAAFWGGLIVTFYPDFIGQEESFMYQPTISGILHHSFSCYLAVLMFLTGYVKPSLKKFYALPIGFCFIMVFGIFLLDALKYEEAMYIFKPLIPNTFVTWYVLGPVITLGSLGLCALWEKVLLPKLEKRKQPE